MGIYRYGVTMDCVDAASVSEFWREALSFDMDVATPEEIEEALRLHPEWVGKALLEDRQARYPRLRFQEVPEPKLGRDRVRWELGVPAHDFDAFVTRFLELRATGDPPTMSHPAGNDFDIVPIDEPAPRFTAIVMESLASERVRAFWGDALRGVAGDIAPMPLLRVVATDAPRLGKNRMHLDLFCQDRGEIEEERQRLHALGARFEDPSTEHLGMSDPEGNEFCLH